jgi:hypothetical protein
VRTPTTDRIKNKLALANKNKIQNEKPLVVTERSRSLANRENNNITEMSNALYLLRI